MKHHHTETPDPAELVREDQVHRHAFVDPSIFELEMQRIFATSWVYIGHESEIPGAGDYKSTRIGIQPVLLTRDLSDQFHLLINACRHRGVSLAEDEELGNCKHFVCPYHGWVFDLSGRLVEVPHPEGQRSSFDVANWSLVPVARVESYRGFIFASLNEAVPELIDHLGLAAPYIDLFVDLSPSGKIDISHGADKYDYVGNWKQQVENSLDAYHAGIVHYSFLEQILKQRTGRGMASIVGPDSPVQSVALGNGHGLIDFLAIDRSAIFGADKPANVSDWHDAIRDRLGDAEYAEQVIKSNGADGFNLLVFPNLALVGSQVRVIQPVRYDYTIVHAYPVLLEGVAAEINTARLRAHEDFYGPAGFGAADDIEMFVRQWQGLKESPAINWLSYERGMDREQVDELGAIRSHVSDETGHRGLWQRWRQLMTENPQ